MNGELFRSLLDGQGGNGRSDQEPGATLVQHGWKILADE